jgi:hypothetical protein
MNKNLALSLLVIGGFTIFSFTKIEEKPNYNLLSEGTIEIINSVAADKSTFTRYERSEKTPDKGTWNYRNETTTIQSFDISSNMLDTLENY